MGGPFEPYDGLCELAPEDAKFVFKVYLAIGAIACLGYLLAVLW